jgi:flagellar hook protein FlgE
MMRALFSAISGMQNHMSFMDVVGNNIANVNTVAYKSSRVNFQDILGQTIKGASSAQSGRGGTNAAQIGLGMSLGGIQTLMTQGSLESTGKSTDLAVQGDGFFVESDGTQTFYSRDGGFDVGTDGSLINPNTGLHVMGWVADATGKIDTQQRLANLVIPYGTRIDARPTTTMQFAGNLDASLANGQSINTTATVYDSLGVPNTANLSFTKLSSTAGGPSYWAVSNSGDSITPTDSANVSISGNPTTLGPGEWDIDDDGAGNLTAKFTPADFAAGPPAALTNPGAGPATITITGTLPAGGTNATLIPGVTLTGASPLGAAGTAKIVIDGQIVQFDSQGQWDPTNAMPSGSLATTNGSVNPESFTLDIAKFTQFSGGSQVALLSQDGSQSGSLVSFSIGSSGEVSGVYSNGLNQTISQIALAGFVNPSGLMRSGQNLWTVSPNSGTPNVGEPNTNGLGTISTGSLETSNVDLAQQFTNLIIAQRGFESSSKVITASDQMLQTLVNIIR